MCTYIDINKLADKKGRQSSSVFSLGTEGKRGCIAKRGESEDSQGQHQVISCKGAPWWPGVDI